MDCKMTDGYNIIINLMGNRQSSDEYSTNRIKEIMQDFKQLGERNDP